MTGNTSILRLITLYVIILLHAQISYGGEKEHYPTVERPPVILSLGEQRMVIIPDLKRYSFGAPLLRVLPGADGGKNGILLKAIQAGVTDWMIWKTDGSIEHRSIEVRSWKKGPVTDLEKRLSTLEQAEVWISGDTEKGKAIYRIGGRVTSPAEAFRIGGILEGFPDEVRNSVEVSNELFTQGEERLRAWVGKSKWREELELVADSDLHSLLVRGGLPDPRTRLEVIKALRKIFPLVQIEIASLPDRDPTIHFKVFLLELRKSKTRSLGIDIPGIFPNALRASRMGIHTALSIEAAINALESDGSARVLSRPELVVRAPGEAELFAGGEVPIESKTAYSSRVEWKSYGLSLKLKVQAASGKKVRADIQTEVSHLDEKLTIDKIPGIQSNRMKTQIDATFGQPLLLSGLLQEGMKKAARGLPFLKDIPVLGLLFGSQDYIEDRSELVAILLPSRNIPEAPRIAAEIERPLGPSPLPRNWISPEDETALRSSPDFPWNAFGSPSLDHTNALLSESRSNESIAEDFQP